MTGSSSASADSAPDPVSAPEPPDDGIALEPPASLPRPARSTRSAQRRPSRRTVLRAAGAGGAALLVGAGAVGARGAANGVWNAGQGAPYELWESWREADGLDRLVAAATLAANPHNIQPWSFTVGEGTIDLYADPQRAMPVNDPDGRERAAGYGCAIENLTLAARYDGYRARVALWPDGGPGVSGPDSADGIDGTARADHVARVVIDTTAPPSERERSLVEAIATRRSNRGPYSPQDLDENLLASLTEDVPVGSGTATAELVWVTEAAAMSALASLYVDATQEIADDAEMSAEAFSWFRGDRAGIERHRDGLTLDGQGLDGPTLAAAKILPAQSRESGDSFWVKRTREVHTATARAWGVIRVPDVADPWARIAGGRLLQRTHLAATVAGLGLHHMNQVSERIARRAALGDEDPLSSRWVEATGVPAGESLLAFRIGYPEHDAVRSPRRALDDVRRPVRT